MTSWSRVDDQAADSVIGFILITSIALAAITIVLMSGGPALDRVQSSQESDAMVRFMGDLDAAVSSLISGAPAGSAPVWQVSMARGSLSLDDDGHLWLITADRRDPGGKEYALQFHSFSDGDQTFTLYNAGEDLTGLEATATVWDGADDEATSVTLDGASSTNVAEDTTAVIELGVPLSGETIELLFFEGDPDSVPPIARVWFVDAGAVEWRSATSDSRVLYESSAIVADEDGGTVFHNTPRIRGPSVKGDGSESIFVRIVKFDGSATVAGRTTTEVLLSSGGNHARFSHGDVERVTLYPPIDLQAAWIGEDCTNPTGRLADDTLGYSYTVMCNPGGDEHEPLAYRDINSLTGASPQLSVTLVETLITLEVQSR